MSVPLPGLSKFAFQDVLLFLKMFSVSSLIVDVIVAHNKDIKDIAEMIPGSGSTAVFQAENAGVTFESMIAAIDTNVVKLPQAPMSKLIFFKKLALLPASVRIISFSSDRHVRQVSITYGESF